MSAVVLRGDARALPLPDASVDLIVTSPPFYALRSYTDEGYCAKCRDLRADGRDPRQAWPDYDAHWAQDHAPRPYTGQVGSEATPGEYVAALLDCTRDWMRVLKPSGSLFVELGDKYAGADAPSRHGQGAMGLRDFGPKTLRIGRGDKHIHRDVDARPKCLMDLPHRYAIRCVDDLGLIKRAEIIWHHVNGLPESVTDRVRRAHSVVFHFTLQPRYYSAVDEVREEHGGNTHAKAGRESPRNVAVVGMFNAGSSSLESWVPNPLGKLPGSVWDIPSQPLTVPGWLGVDHFAAWPMEISRRIISGWSPPGICTACGQGRRPVSDGVTTPTQRTHNGYTRGDAQGQRGGMIPLPMRRTTTITGYACACTTDLPGPEVETGPVHRDPSTPRARELPSTRPALVLDPFGGTGTTALVASMLGRTGISIDRSADYSRLARWRVTDPAERARALGVPKPPPVPAGQVSLFDLDGEAS